MGKIQKCRKWVSCALTERQMENRKITCDILLQRQENKSVMHRIITGDEKWVGLIKDSLQHQMQSQNDSAR